MFIVEPALACILLFFGCGCGAFCYPRTNVVLPETPSSSPSSHASRRLYTKHADTTIGADSLIEDSSADDPVDLNPPAYVDVVETAAIRIHPSLRDKTLQRHAAQLIGKAETTHPT
jgi:hypothetical protein